jgi:hypothetical protein
MNAQQKWLTAGALLLLATSCSDEGNTTVPLPLLPQPPRVTITGLAPSTVVVGNVLTFTISANLEIPNGIRAQDPVLISVTPPLGSRVGVQTLDVAQIPGCFEGSTFCTLNNIFVDASEVSLTVSGSYGITLSVLDLAGQVGQDVRAINATL